MQVASLELCRTLYELSGWDETAFEYLWDSEGEAIEYAYHEVIRAYQHEHCPAYDLGYLLRKLPRKLNGVNSKQRDGNFNLYASRGKGAWVASYADEDGSVIRRLKKDAETQNHRNFWFVAFSADTPEDATAKLAIELFKQGILKEGLQEKG